MLPSLRATSIITMEKMNRLRHVQLKAMSASVKNEFP